MHGIDSNTSTASPGAVLPRPMHQERDPLLCSKWEKSLEKAQKQLAVKGLKNNKYRQLNNQEVRIPQL